MTLVGIVSVHKINKLFSHIINKKIILCPKFGEEICFLPIEICYYRNIKALHKKFEKAKAMLTNEHVSGIVMTKELSELLGVEDFKGIPSENLIECFEYLYNKRYTAQYQTICLVDNNLSLFDYQALTRIVCTAKDIVIYTYKVDKGKAMSERLFEEYGLWVKIYHISLYKKVNNTHMLIDADRGKIRIGDIVIDGVEYDADCGKYDVDLRCLTGIPCIGNTLKIKNLIAGKNLIKLVDN